MKLVLRVTSKTEITRGGSLSNVFVVRFEHGTPLDGTSFELTFHESDALAFRVGKTYTFTVSKND